MELVGEYNNRTIDNRINKVKSDAMNSKLIYVVEDEPDIAELLKLTLESEGAVVSHFIEGRDVLQQLQSKSPDMILLDLMLPDMSGFEICKRLRQDSRLAEVPVIMVTAKGEEVDIVKGLEMGADDYVTKPFSPKVLVSRINNIFKRSSRSKPNEEGLLVKGPITIHKGRFEVSVNQKPVKLTKSEFSILLLLASHPGWVYSRSQIVDAIRGDNYSVTERTVDFQMVGLRKKLAEAGKLIETVRGIGYKFQDI